jgi:hypothetical protein
MFLRPFFKKGQYYVFTTFFSKRVNIMFLRPFFKKVNIMFLRPFFKKVKVNTDLFAELYSKTPMEGV